MTSKEIRKMISDIQRRREEIRRSPHPSIYKREWIDLIRTELDLTVELERRKAAGEINLFKLCSPEIESPADSIYNKSRRGGE